MAENGISTLPTKEERQLAKLALAAVKRAAQGKPSSFNINQLPSRYVGNASVPNSHPAGLLPGRPWAYDTIEVNLDFSLAKNSGYYGILGSPL
jgi:hypothetical protein